MNIMKPFPCDVMTFGNTKEMETAAMLVYNEIVASRVILAFRKKLTMVLVCGESDKIPLLC